MTMSPCQTNCWLGLQVELFLSLGATISFEPGLRLPEDCDNDDDHDNDDGSDDDDHDNDDDGDDLFTVFNIPHFSPSDLGNDCQV